MGTEGANHSPSRLAQRNGSRHRCLNTRACTVGVAGPRRRVGSACRRLVALTYLARFER
ncbi:transposase [Arthrobacter pityocampae]|uniref:transposase n=1 Tax=Arthrobacter pityocampae TaxID=547334 RepID=UPI0011B07F6F|nr:transposase [Arthrobacter pityocampae]